eukprot:1208-Amorphochlora_amoeboformis.AAC.2
MSSNERHGSSDAGADQGLAAHWAIVSLTIFGVVVISCYSQYKCHALERRGIRLRAVATALQVCFSTIYAHATARCLTKSIRT